MRILLVVCVSLAVAAGFLLETMVRATAATTGAGGAVYTANNTGSSVSALDGGTLAPVHGDIQTFGVSGAVAVSPDGLRVYSVGGTDGERITVIDATTNEPITSVEVDEGENLTDLAVSPDGAKVYMTGQNAGAVWVFDTASNTNAGKFPLQAVTSTPIRPSAIALTPDGAFAFVLGEQNTRLQKMRLSDGMVVNNVTVASGSVELAVSRDGATLMVVGAGAPQFLGTSTLAPVTGPETFPLGNLVDAAAGGARLYALNDNYSPLVKGPLKSAAVNGQPSIDVYGAATGALVESIDLGAGSTVLGIAVTPDGSCAYVSRVGSENVGSVTRVDLTTGTLGPTGNAGGTPRRVALKLLQQTTPIDSYFLPRKVDLKFNGPGKDTLKAAGTYDDGGATVDYTQPVTIQVGGFSRTFTPAPKGAAFVFKDANFSVKLTPNVKTSSRGIFKIGVKKSTLQGLIDIAQPVEFHFTAAGLPDAGGEVLLTNGRYRIQKVRGALVAPGFFPVKAKATLGDGATDSLTLLGGFATDGETPGALGSVRVAFGSSFSRTIPGASFKGKNGVFTYTSPAGGEKLRVLIDFRRELFVVTAKKVELGALASPAIDLTFDAGGGKGAFTTTVRVASAGNKRLY